MGLKAGDGFGENGPDIMNSARSR